MRDFQEFLDKKIAVEATDEFMRLCEDEGLQWNSGKKPTEQKIHPYITFRANGDDAISGDCLDYFKRKGYQIVTAAEFLPKAPTIEIFQSKQTVVCLKKQDGKVVAAGKAKCNPEDEFDFDYGAKLAFERMQADIARRSMKSVGESIAKGISDGIKGAVDALKGLSDEMNGIKTLKNGMRIKKQDKYEVGDRVLVKKKYTEQFRWGNMREFLGKEAIINCCDNTDEAFKVDGCDYWFKYNQIKGKVM